jgi:hypothetical protein
MQLQPQNRPLESKAAIQSFVVLTNPNERPHVPLLLILEHVPVPRGTISHDHVSPYASSLALLALKLCLRG